MKKAVKKTVRKATVVEQTSDLVVVVGSEPIRVQTATGSFRIHPDGGIQFRPTKFKWSKCFPLRMVCNLLRALPG